MRAAPDCFAALAMTKYKNKKALAFARASLDRAVPGKLLGRSSLLNRLTVQSKVETVALDFFRHA